MSTEDDWLISTAPNMAPSVSASDSGNEHDDYLVDLTGADALFGGSSLPLQQQQQRQQPVCSPMDSSDEKADSMSSLSQSDMSLEGFALDDHTGAMSTAALFLDGELPPEHWMSDEDSVDDPVGPVIDALPLGMCLPVTTASATSVSVDNIGENVALAVAKEAELFSSSADDVVEEIVEHKPVLSSTHSSSAVDGHKTALSSTLSTSAMDEHKTALSSTLFTSAMDKSKPALSSTLPSSAVDEVTPVLQREQVPLQPASAPITSLKRTASRLRSPSKHKSAFGGTAGNASTSTLPVATLSSRTLNLPMPAPVIVSADDVPTMSMEEVLATAAREVGVCLPSTRLLAASSDELPSGDDQTLAFRPSLTLSLPGTPAKRTDAPVLSRTSSSASMPASPVKSCADVVEASRLDMDSLPASPEALNSSRESPFQSLTTENQRHAMEQWRVRVDDDVDNGKHGELVESVQLDQPSRPPSSLQRPSMLPRSLSIASSPKPHIATHAPPVVSKLPLPSSTLARSRSLIARPKRDRSMDSVQAEPVPSSKPSWTSPFRLGFGQRKAPEASLSSPVTVVSSPVKGKGPMLAPSNALMSQLQKLKLGGKNSATSPAKESPIVAATSPHATTPNRLTRRNSFTAASPARRRA